MLYNFISKFEGRNIMSWAEYDKLHGDIPPCPSLIVLINIRDPKITR